MPKDFNAHPFSERDEEADNVDELREQIDEIYTSPQTGLTLEEEEEFNGDSDDNFFPFADEIELDDDEESEEEKEDSEEEGGEI